MIRSKDEIKLRDNDAEHYDKWYLDRGINAVTVEDTTILNYLKLKDVNNLLDLGCGTGRLTEKIAKMYQNLSIIGLDISPKSIEILNNKKKTNIKAFTFDASKDNIYHKTNMKYERILSMQMIQHLEKDSAIKTVNDIYNSLDKNGIAIIELYNYSGFNRILERIRSFGRIKKIQRKGLFFEYRYGADEFKDFILKYSDFNNVDIYGCQNISRRWLKKFPLLVKFDLWLSRFKLSKYLGYYFIAVLKK